MSEKIKYKKILIENFIIIKEEVIKPFEMNDDEEIKAVDLEKPCII